ncbi:NADP-dependent malic enzyme [Cyphellophora attinorum]|uniref:Malic enzyme n=1 Tax=Cyphellophora attinorum TaxID=1664694 RepID=A0A0N1P2C4_9EURO|nr:NADP-dependent malic enzyme [Phialophora attinorum]KPI45307.1 NADP-dependent malic enzyme [Phialophora attinorum]
MTLAASSPPNVGNADVQERRCLSQLRSAESDLEKFIYLSSLRLRQPHLYYRLLVKHFVELAPLQYTPTVGEACLRWSEIYRQPEGLYISYERDRGSLRKLLQNWPQEKVAITVVTDGSRILGLGDIGVNGMGIPIGKLALYVACGGVDPRHVLPITVDLGTNNEDLRANEMYMGSRNPKPPRHDEEAFLDELMEALTGRWPGIVVQFEDWKNPWYTLEKYGPKYAMFNDDIQGTGAVIMAGIITAVRLSGLSVRDHRAVFFGAGSAAVGVAKQIVQYFMAQGLSEDEARGLFWLVDRHGLVTKDRGDDLPDHKRYFARDDNGGQQFARLEETAKHVKPTILVGLSGVHNAFHEDLLHNMSSWSKRPIIFPLSNPTSASECTFEQAINATEGRALFAAGSPFAAIKYHGDEYHPAQGNNMYVFPGLGQGAILSQSKHVTQNMVYAAGAAIPDVMLKEEVKAGLLYPELDRKREVGRFVTMRVIRAAQKDEVDRATDLRRMSDDELLDWISKKMYDPFRVDD